MTVVAYNANANDEFVNQGKKAQKALGYTGISDLAGKLVAAYPNGGISTLLIVDHGAAGIQGVGSGTGHDLSEYKNLNADHFQVFSKGESALSQHASNMTATQLSAARVAQVLHTVAMSGVNDWQAPHLRTITGCIASRGVLFLCGCQVAADEHGKDMIRDLALYVQNSISVVACTTYVTWRTVEHKAKTYTVARWAGGKGVKLEPYYLVGYMGARRLSTEELQAIVDGTVITADTWV